MAHILLRHRDVENIHQFAAYESNGGYNGLKQALSEMSPDEVRDTIGSKHGEAAEKALSADVKAVGRLGLVKISAHRIEFAVSIDQIAVDDVAGFWQMFDQIKNKARVVPLPRRTCRALAKGMTKGDTGMVLALVIRSLFWHKREGEYRIDGRTKCSWIAEVFQLDRKTISTARASLIKMGWMEEVPCEQWELNKWGQRYRLNLDAFGPKKAPTEDGKNPSPEQILSGVIPSPCLNNSTSSYEETLKNRKPDPTRSGSGSVGSRKKKVGKSRAKLRGPMLHNVRSVDLGDTERLLELHRQAIEAGHPVGGEKGRLDFVALAERAKAQGNSAPKLFAWLLRAGRFDFITMEDEDAAVARLRRHRNQSDPRNNRRSEGESSGGRAVKRQTRQEFIASLPEDHRFVVACLKVGNQRRIDPFRIAQAKGWTRDRWDDARMAYELADKQRWHIEDADRSSGFFHLMDDSGE